MNIFIWYRIHPVNIEIFVKTNKIIQECQSLVEVTATDLTVATVEPVCQDFAIFHTTIDYIPARRYPFRCYPDRCVQIGVLIKDVVH